MLYLKKFIVEISFFIIYVVLLVYAYLEDTHNKNISDENIFYSGYIIIILCFLCFIGYSVIDIYWNLKKIKMFRWLL